MKGEFKNMKTKYIKITNSKDLYDFIKQASKVKEDILIYRGKFCVDGKSLMGIMSLNISEGCKVEYPEKEKEFEEYLKKFEYNS